MSGGSMGYLYYKVENADFRTHTVLRRMFNSYLKLIAKALHDIEWVDSGDYAEGDEESAIYAALNPSLSTTLVNDIDSYINELKEIKEKLNGDV